jgi:hypothetical protein
MSCGEVVKAENLVEVGCRPVPLSATVTLHPNCFSTALSLTTTDLTMMPLLHYLQMSIALCMVPIIAVKCDARMPSSAER